MRSLTISGMWLLGLGVVVWLALVPGEIRGQESAVSNRTPVAHALDTSERVSTTETRSEVQQADARVYQAAARRPVGTSRRVTRYRTDYETGLSHSGAYNYRNYGLGGYGLGGNGLQNHGLGSYGQSTMGWGNYGSAFNFSGYSGYAGSSSYNYDRGYPAGMYGW